jgi:FecR protein
MEKKERLILIISVMIILFATLIYFMLPTLFTTLNPPNQNFIGIVADIKGDAKVRYGDSISWRTLNRKDKIYANSNFFTGENSHATFAFKDKSSLTLDSNSLVFLNFAPVNTAGTEGNPIDMELVEGKLEIDLKKKSNFHKIKIDDATIDISKEATKIKLSTSAESKVEVSVLKGEVAMAQKGKKYTIKSGQVLGISKLDLLKRDEVDPSMLDEITVLDENNVNYLEETQKNRSFSHIFAGAIRTFKVTFGIGEHDTNKNDE